LHRAHLITEPAAERWGMHDLVRLYAADQHHPPARVTTRPARPGPGCMATTSTPPLQRTPTSNRPCRPTPARSPTGTTLWPGWMPNTVT
jgi:hypothetical protein